MGRPINSSKIGSGSGKIKVTRYRFTGASEATSPTAYILAQKGTRKFRVTDGTSTETLRLVNKAAGALAEGEFAIDAALDDSSIVQVTKLKNRTITYEDTTQITYVIGPVSGDEDATDSKANVDGQ